MDAAPQLTPGIYLNIFPVNLPVEAVPVMQAPRSSFQDLRPLREELEDKNVWVYADGDLVYGYGPEMLQLEARGFDSATVQLVETPRLATRLIVEGLANALMADGYECFLRMGRWQAYSPTEFSEVAGGKVRVHQGYDMRAYFWRDLASDELVFGLILDINWLLRDSAGQPLSMRNMKQQYGSGIAVEIGRVQSEYLPRSNKINTEVARQRIQEHVLPVIRRYPEFDLPIGGRVSLLPEPVRVILGGDER